MLYSFCINVRPFVLYQGADTSPCGVDFSLRTDWKASACRLKTWFCSKHRECTYVRTYISHCTRIYKHSEIYLSNSKVAKCKDGTCMFICVDIKEKQNRDGILKSIVSRYSYTILISTENLLSEIKDHLCVRDY